MLHRHKGYYQDMLVQMNWIQKGQEAAAMSGQSWLVLYTQQRSQRKTRLQGLVAAVQRSKGQSESLRAEEPDWFLSVHLPFHVVHPGKHEWVDLWPQSPWLALPSKQRILLKQLMLGVPEQVQATV